MGSSSSESSDSTTVAINTIRYAPYIETQHQTFLNRAYTFRQLILFDDPPFDDYENHVIEDAFFGYGYVLKDFPALYDMFSEYMSGVDAETLFDETYEDTINSPAVNEIVKLESDFLSDDINNNSLPRLNLGKTNVNACFTETFLAGESIIDDIKTKSVTKFEAQLKYSLIPTVQTKWATHLNWNKGIIDSYQELINFYYATKLDMEEKDYSVAASNTLWPFTVLDFERAALGALQGAVSRSGAEAIKGGSTSRGRNALSGALTGAAFGAMISSAVKSPTSAEKTAKSGTSSDTSSNTKSTTDGGGSFNWGTAIGAAAGVAVSFLK